MSNYFSRTFRVRWSETNAYGQVDLTGFLHFAVETAWDWGAANGLSAEESERLGLAWVIRETEISFHRPLTPGDVIEFRIWLVKWRRVRGTRCFEIRLKDGGELVAQGVQQVVTLDSKTMRPYAPPENLLAGFLVENPRVFPIRQFPKYQSQSEHAYQSERAVEWGDLDSLDHVNNATYAILAENEIVKALASLGWTPSRFKNQGLAFQNRRLHIQYLSPAIWGDILNVTVSLTRQESKGGTWYMEINRASDGEPIIRCEIDWAIIDHQSGEEQYLPENFIHTLKKFDAISEKDDPDEQP